MVDSTSRYRALAIYDSTDADSRATPAIPIRYVGQPRPDLLHHRLTALETLEALAYRYYRNSREWWRLADANDARFPLDWESGDAVALPDAGEVGQIQRTRRF